MSQEVQKNFVDLAHWTVLGEFTPQILHELSNPLQVVLGFAQELQESLPADSAYARDVAMIIEEAKRCCHIVKSAQALQKIREENGYQDVKIVLDRILPLLGHKIRKKNLTFKQDIPLDLEFVEGERVQITLLLLLSAVVEASEQDSEVEVLAFKQDESIHVEIHFRPDIALQKHCSDSKKGLLELLAPAHSCRLDDLSGYYALTLAAGSSG